MTLEELLARESIRKTIANYTMAGDRLRIDDFVAQFTEDAVLESDGVVASDAFHYQGRQAMREWFSRW
ncbi:MAG TPA: nuclear transport factor 2 family protein, partial [Halioglobus sp.]